MKLILIAQFFLNRSEPMMKYLSGWKYGENLVKLPFFVILFLILLYIFPRNGQLFRHIQSINLFQDNIFKTTFYKQ